MFPRPISPCVLLNDSISLPLQDDYIRRLMALRYLLSRDSGVHIPALRDKVMMGVCLLRPALKG
jgi:hypothetical protein